MIILKEQFIKHVLNSMYDILNCDQLRQLENVLYITMMDVDIQTTKKEIMPVDETWKNDLSDFLMHKRINGRSVKTIKKYNEHLQKLLSYYNKNIDEITDGDIYNYMNVYSKARGIQNRSLENMRLVFSSFFNWAFQHKRVSTNPMTIINKIKTDYKLKKPYSDEEMEMLSYGCKNSRDHAMIEFLYSSCVRVGELEKLNINDINLSKHELVVYGKGNKERTTYINARTYIRLKHYLDSRTDSNPALFVSLKKPNNRLSIQGIEAAVKRIGKRAGVNNVHPHRFRRTGATNAINRGMPIQEVSLFLGHENISTTQLYSIVDQRNVKFSHERYLSA